MKKLMVVPVVLVGLGLFAGCTQQQESKKDDFKVVTTFYPMYDLTKEIVGDAGEVSQVIPNGVEPHDYEPTAKNMADIQSADAFVYNTKYLETWAEKVGESQNKDEAVIVASKGISLVEGGEEEEEEAHSNEKSMDPHVWLSPKLAMKEVANIRDGLIKAYPAKKEVFEKNTEAFLKKLTQLDEEYQTALQGAKQKNIVTQHAAFAYLAKDYGLNQVAISGLSPEEEPSAARLAELKEYVKKNNIKIIYFEEMANDKIAKTLANECGIELAVLNPLEGLTKEEQESGADYISVMKENLKQLQKTVK